MSIKGQKRKYSVGQFFPTVPDGVLLPLCIAIQKFNITAPHNFFTIIYLGEKLVKDKTNHPFRSG